MECQIGQGRLCDSFMSSGRCFRSNCRFGHGCECTPCKLGLCPDLEKISGYVPMCKREQCPFAHESCACAKGKFVDFERCPGWNAGRCVRGDLCPLAHVP